MIAQFLSTGRWSRTVVSLFAAMAGGIGALNAQVYWDNSAGNSLWGTGSNWSSGSVPGTTTDVIFDNTYVSTDQTLNLASTNRTVRTATFSSALNYTLNNTSATRRLEFYGTSTNFTQSGSGNVVINAPVWLSTGLFMAGNGTGLATINGIISDGAGTDTVQKSGTFTLVLNGANSQDGTILNAGTIEFGNNAAAGSGGLTLNGGTIRAGGGSRTLTNAITVGGDFTVDGSNALTLSGNMALGGTTRTVTTDNTATTTFSGAVSGTAGLTKAGAGDLVLSGTNTYSGTTTISAGVLQIGAGGTTGTLGTGSVTNNASLIINRSNAYTVSNAISGTGSLTQAGTGTTTLSGANTYTGTTTVSAGALNIQHASALGTTAAGTTVASGAALELQHVTGIAVGAETLGLSGTGVGAHGALRNVSGANPWTGAITLAASSEIQSDAGTLTVSGNISSTNLALTLDGAGATVLSGVVGLGTGALTKNGAGTATLSGANTYTGDTNVNAGPLQLGASNVLADATDVIVASGATFDLNNFSDTVASIAGAGNITLDAGTLTAGGGNTSTTFSGVMSETGNFVKAGTGITTFSGVNTYTGTTTVSAGTLRLGVANALNSATAITVAGGAIFDLNNFSDTVGSVAGAGSITLGSGTLTAGWDNTSTTFSGVISETGSLIKTGSGTLTLSGANSYTGTTTVNAGTLRSGAANVLPNTAVTVSGTGAGATATLDLNGFSDTIGSLTLGGSTTTSGASVTTGAGTLTLGGNVTYDATSNPLGATIAGNLSLGGANRTFTIGDSTSAATDLAVSAVISSAGGLIKTGAGTLVLSSANTYTGATSINNGTLSINTLANVSGGSSALGAPTTVANGTIAIGTGATGATLAYTGAGSSSNRVISLAGTTGGATLNASGSGALTLTSAFTATGAGSKTLTLTGTSTMPSMHMIVKSTSLKSRSLTPKTRKWL